MGLALRLIFLSFRSRKDLVVEDALLRQQLALYANKRPRPRLTRMDRVRLAVLSLLLSAWRDVMVVVSPATVVRWHRSLWRLCWRWRSRKKRVGRPPVDQDVIALVEQMTVDHPTWGAPRIHGEMRKLGFEVSQSTVQRYMPWRPTPSGKWATFLMNELDGIAAIDFFAIPTAKMKLLWGMVVLDLKRRRLRHTAVTEELHGDWIKRQLKEAFPFEETKKHVIRDNDPVYGNWMKKALAEFGAEEVRIAVGSPTMNAFAERVIGSIRRELFDHVVVVNDDHARVLLAAYRKYYNTSRTHLSLGKDAPDCRPHQRLEDGDNIVAIPVLGGLHARYERRKE